MRSTTCRPLPKTAKKMDSHLDWLLHKPAAPAIPQVKNTAWVVNPIDAFVLQKLEANGMSPAPPASKRALLRRVYFDLIGLPPTAEQVHDFENNTAPDAYEKVVDKLLADSRYGERWARHWLDLARFAESDGFAIDGERPTAWRYRDYVIRSFNQDKPYDRFVEEQLAGDEMPAGGARRRARSDRLVALGFLRMGTWEADANFKTQLRQDVLNELTGTVGQVFLGFTVGCARCHDHKYDPIPQRDFYRLQAFFAPMKVDNREAPFSDVEGGSKAMRDKLRTYEDKSDEADESLRKMEADLKAQYRPKGEAPTAARRPESGWQGRGTRRLHGGAQESQGHSRSPPSRRRRGERQPTLHARLANLWRATVRWPTRYRTWCRRRFPIWRPLMSWPAAICRAGARPSRPDFFRR